MLCDRCNKNEACIFIREHGPHGAKSMNLCPQCAIKPLLKNAPDFMPDIFQQLHKLLTGQNDDQIEKMLAEMTNAGTKRSSCTLCGRKEEDFTESYELGCAECAKAFRELMDDHLHHCGVVWPPADQQTSTSQTATRRKTKDINRLSAELCQAIRHENYKLAAQLRDQLRDLTNEQED